MHYRLLSTVRITEHIDSILHIESMIYLFFIYFVEWVILTCARGRVCHEITYFLPRNRATKSWQMKGSEANICNIGGNLEKLRLDCFKTTGIGY